MKVGIFAPCQAGDVITATAVLRHKEQLWPGAEVVWYCNDPIADALRFAPIEVRPCGPELDFDKLKQNMGVGEGCNRLDLSLAKTLDITKDLDLGFFPLTWMISAEQRGGLPYPEVSRRIFNVNSPNWRPCLWHSDEERQMVKEMMAALPFKRSVMIENSPCCYSSWDDTITTLLMAKCREKWGDCNFVFASGGTRSGNDMTRFFSTGFGCISASNLTARQISLVNDHCDLFAGLAGALTYSTSRWGAKPTPKLVYTGSHRLFPSSIANGPIEVVDGESYGHNPGEFERRLVKLLGGIE